MIYKFGYLKKIGGRAKGFALLRASCVYRAHEKFPSSRTGEGGISERTAPLRLTDWRQWPLPGR